MEAEEFLSEPELDVPDPSEGEEKTSAKAEWSRQYKLARSYLCGGKKVPQDFQEAEQGNALAMYEQVITAVSDGANAAASAVGFLNNR